MCAVYEYATARAYVTRTGGTGKTYTIYIRYRRVLMMKMFLYSVIYVCYRKYIPT